MLKSQLHSKPYTRLSKRQKPTKRLHHHSNLIRKTSTVTTTLPRRAAADFESEDYPSESSEDDRFGFNPKPDLHPTDFTTQRMRYNPKNINELEDIISDPVKFTTLRKEEQTAMYDMLSAYSELIRYDQFVQNKILPIIQQQLHLALILYGVLPQPQEDNDLLYPQKHILECLIAHGIIQRATSDPVTSNMNLPEPFLSNKFVQKYNTMNVELFQLLQSLHIIPINNLDDINDPRNDPNQYIYQPGIINPFHPHSNGTFSTNLDPTTLSSITVDTELDSSVVNVFNAIQASVIMAGAYDYQKYLIDVDTLTPVQYIENAQRIKALQPQNESFFTDFSKNTITAALSPQEEGLFANMTDDLRNTANIMSQNDFLNKIFPLFHQFQRNDVLKAWTFKNTKNQQILEKLLSFLPDVDSSQTNPAILSIEDKHGIVDLITHCMIQENAYSLYLHTPFQSKVFSAMISPTLSSSIISNDIISKEKTLTILSNYIIKRQMLLFNNNEKALQEFHDPESIKILQDLDKFANSPAVEKILQNEKYNIVIQSPSLDPTVNQEIYHSTFIQRLMQVNYLSRPGDAELDALKKISQLPKEESIQQKKLWNNTQILNELCKRKILQKIPLQSDFKHDSEAVLAQPGHKEDENTKWVRELDLSITPRGLRYRVDVNGQQKEYLVPCYETQVLAHLMKFGLLDQNFMSKQYNSDVICQFLPLSLTPMILPQDSDGVIKFKRSIIENNAFPIDHKLAAQQLQKFNSSQQKQESITSITEIESFLYWTNSIEPIVQNSIRLRDSEPETLSTEEFIELVNQHKLFPAMKFKPMHSYAYILGDSRPRVNKSIDNPYNDDESTEDDPKHNPDPKNEDKDCGNSDSTTDYECDSDDSDQYTGSISNERFIGYPNIHEIVKSQGLSFQMKSWVRNAQNDAFLQQFAPSYDHIIQGFTTSSLASIRGMILDTYQHDIMLNFKLDQPELYFKILSDMHCTELTDDELLLTKNLLGQLTTQLQLKAKFQTLLVPSFQNKLPFEYEHVLLQNKSEMQQSAAYCRKIYAPKM